MGNQKRDQELTAHGLRKLLHYDPETGVFRWLVPLGKRMKSGDIAGYGREYWQIGILKKIYKAHRLAWLYMTGSWPEHLIDHINCNGLDNRWVNLRAANFSQNAANKRPRPRSSTGLKGASFHKRRAKYQAKIGFGGKTRYLGEFDSAEEAALAYEAAAKKLYGDFARVK